MARFDQILVIDDDPSMRALVRLALEMDGKHVREADSLATARHALDSPVDGIVLDRELPDGDGLTLLPDIAVRHPGARVVVSSDLPADEPPALIRIAKDDTAALTAAFGHTMEDPLPLGDLIRVEAEEIERAWRELCRRDPSLPADSEPRAAGQLLEAIAATISPSHPLGLAPDQHLQASATAFVNASGNTSAAGEQLACLREVLARLIGERLRERVTWDELLEGFVRVNAVIDKAMAAVSAHSEGTTVDPVTGLPNRRAFERDLLTFPTRINGSFSVIVLDLVDEHPSPGTVGDMAATIRRSIRPSDRAFRIGHGEFAIVLEPGDRRSADALVKRLRPTAPLFRSGAAGGPADGHVGREVVAVADSRLVAQRLREVSAARRREAQRTRRDRRPGA